MVKQLSFSNRFLLLFFALSTATMLCAKSFSFFQSNGLNGWKLPKREVRAVWLTTIGGLDWPHSYAQNELMAGRQKQELCDILDKLQRAGINTVLFQARVRGTVVYPSQLEPWDGCLSGVPGRVRPLGLCHRRMS